MHMYSVRIRRPLNDSIVSVTLIKKFLDGAESFTDQTSLALHSKGSAKTPFLCEANGIKAGWL